MTPTYAVLGATGATGSSILTLLLAQSPQPTIHVYVRSASKLHAAFPSLRDNKKVHIHAGAITEVSVMKACVEDADVVFATVASNSNTAGLHIAQDTTNVLIAAFSLMRKEDAGARIPTVVVLSSASMNEEFEKNTPGWVKWLVHFAVSNVYLDLGLAEVVWNMHRSWVDVILVQPGALIEDEQRGHEVLVQQPKKAFLSYMDLAAGMIEIAERRKEFAGKKVTVGATGDTRFSWQTPVNLLRGLMSKAIPYAT